MLLSLLGFGDYEERGMKLFLVIDIHWCIVFFHKTITLVLTHDMFKQSNSGRQTLVQMQVS